MDGVSIGVTDIVVIGLYLVFITWWGLRHVRNSDAGSYFLAGRTMPWWAVGLALFAASISSTTLIGQSGDAYHTGIAVFNYNLTGGVVVMVLFAIFLLPLYIRSGIFTIPEFLEKRFDRRSRYYFSAISIIGSMKRSEKRTAFLPLRYTAYASAEAKETIKLTGCMKNMVQMSVSAKYMKFMMG
jgi:SSS family solute:Na+ symporter